MADPLALLTAERDRLAADLAALDAAIATVRRVLGGQPAAPAVEGPPPGKPVPRPAAGSGVATPVRVRVARFLLDHGPARVGQMVAARVASQPTINAALRTDWFRKTGAGNLDPWELTEAGRTSLAELPAQLPPEKPADAAA